MSKVKIVSDVVHELGSFAKTAGSQITGSEGKKQKEETKEFVKGLYGMDKSKMRGSTSEGVEPLKIEDQQKIAKLRQELHDQTYFKNIVNPSASWRTKEERQAEKVEKEKKQKLAELEQKEAKKPPPLPPSAKRGTVEKYPGVSG